MSSDNKITAAVMTPCRIKVATMNYGLWNDGCTIGVPTDAVPEVLARWKQMLADHDVDILAGQEYMEYFDRDKTMLAATCLFADRYPYHYQSGARSMVSKIACDDFASYNCPPPSKRRYTKAYATIGGRRVCLINAHCAIEPDFTISRQGEFEDLIRVMATEEYVILFGDFNTYSVSEFDMFKQAGYQLVNCGAFGEFNTWTHFDSPSTWKNQAIDNIIVTPNIRIESVMVDRRDLSDHNMLVTELTLM